jgi:hypothetical protein
VRKVARKEKEEWLQRQYQEIEKHTGNRRYRKAYRVIKQISRK